MFESSHIPRVFGLPPGVDFPKVLVDGLMAKQAGQPPEALARVELIVNMEAIVKSVNGEEGTKTPITLPILFAPRLYEPKAPATMRPTRVYASVRSK